MAQEEDIKYFVRVGTTDLDGTKSVRVALTGIMGVGRHTSTVISRMAKVDEYAQLGRIDEESVNRLRTAVEQYSSKIPSWMANRPKDIYTGEAKQLLPWYPARDRAESPRAAHKVYRKNRNDCGCQEEERRRQLTMGYPGKNHKSYQTPKRPFEKTRIESETRLVIEYGLRNKREVWKAQSYLRKYRKGARDLLALMSSNIDRTLFEAKKTELISHMQRSGLLGPDADIEDVLALKVQTQLERRLQSLVHRKGLARSPKQARQLITHGHIAIGGRRVTIPGYRVNRNEEVQIAYYGKSPFLSDSHPEKSRITKPAGVR
jgi:small subunit ribosomal protein S4